MAELIKTKIRPVLDSISSIRTQISQYEKMEHIPGGPKHFIATTLKELDRIELEMLLNLELEVISKLLNYKSLLIVRIELKFSQN